MKLFKVNAVPILFLFCSLASFGQTIIQPKNDYFEITLDKQDNDPVRVLQVTDLHIGSTGFWKQDLISIKRIKRLVEMHDPDIIAITGDLFTGEKPYGSLLAAFAVQFFDGLDRPWLYTFGNHDPEGGFGRDEIYEIFDASEWGVIGFHPVPGEIKKKYDFLVDVKVGQNETPVWQFYAFDSGSKKGFKSIKADQLKWYKRYSNISKAKYGKKVRAISFFHIPLIQYQYLVDDKSLSFEGENREKVYYEEDDGSVYDTFVEVGNIEATFCGHDHYNNYWGEYKGGIILAYGFISGESTNYAWPPGGKLITLPIGDGEIKIENVSPVFEKEKRRGKQK
jgi:3',5'-cyclic AMP phosphodiesterase CpdA